MESRRCAAQEQPPTRFPRCVIVVTGEVVVDTIRPVFGCLGCREKMKRSDFLKSCPVVCFPVAGDVDTLTHSSRRISSPPSRMHLPLPLAQRASRHLERHLQRPRLGRQRNGRAFRDFRRRSVDRRILRHYLSYVIISAARPAADRASPRSRFAAIGFLRVFRDGRVDFSSKMAPSSPAENVHGWTRARVRSRRPRCDADGR